MSRLSQKKEGNIGVCINMAKRDDIAETIERIDEHDNKICRCGHMKGIHTVGICMVLGCMCKEYEAKTK
jgi:hypothetical protein